MKLIRAVVLTVLCIASTVSWAKSLGQALGYGPKEKILLIHADDMGSVNSANEAIADLFSAGLVKSASLMMPCPASPGAVVYAMAHPDADLGVHVTLTSEWKKYRWGPLLNPLTVRSLVGFDGNFFDGLLPLFAWGRERDVEAEIEEQIQAVIRSGVRPTHIDTHQGAIFVHPSWFSVYLKLARKYHLAPMVPRWSEELKENFFGPALGEFMELLKQSGIFSAQALLDGAEKDGFLPLDYVYMFPEPVSKSNSFDERKTFYKNLISGLKPGVSQIMIHPAYNRGDFSGILASDSNQVLRDYEAHIFQDSEIRALIESQHVRLIGWREILNAYNY